MNKKILLILLATCITYVSFNIITENKSASAAAQAEIAMELSTGSVLCENNSNLRLPMASTTKIMTAIIIIEDCELDTVINADNKAVGAEGSSIYLKYNEEIDIKDLLYGLMLRSGNDCAVALALYHSGSVEKFAQVMNERAKKIGAKDTNFKNPSGLPEEGHYTTAYDLCKIACYAMNNEQFRQIVSTKNYVGKYRNFTNKNKMLSKYPDATGIKTGYTIAAGRCLVSSAERDGMEVVCVVLNCPDMYDRSCSILDSCYNNYKKVELSEDRYFICDGVLCKPNKNSYFIVKKESSLIYKLKSIENKKNSAEPSLVGLLEIYSENELIFTEKLCSI